MSRGLRSVAADADELARLLGIQSLNVGAMLMQKIERFLTDSYRKLYDEGFEDGKLSAQVGGMHKDNPYGP